MVCRVSGGFANPTPLWWSVGAILAAVFDWVRSGAIDPPVLNLAGGRIRVAVRIVPVSTHSSWAGATIGNGNRRGIR